MKKLDLAMFPTLHSVAVTQQAYRVFIAACIYVTGYIHVMLIALVPFWIAVKPLASFDLI